MYPRALTGATSWAIVPSTFTLAVTAMRQVGMSKGTSLDVAKEVGASTMAVSRVVSDSAEQVASKVKER